MKLPKTRTNTLASRQGQGSGRSNTRSSFNNVEDTAERINDRLRQAGPITIEVESRSRGQMEEVNVSFMSQPGTASVSSASGNTYTVDYINGNCNCMHHTARQLRCRHMNAVDEALGQVTESQDIDLRSLSDGIGQRVEMDHQEEEQRRRLSGIQEDDNFFYLDNEAEFENRLRNYQNITYEYENALNGSNATFGLEIEFVGGDANAIARELYDLGICGYRERVRYHERSIPGKWKLERDGTVSSGDSGGELVSPVLRDTPETWRDIETICNVAKRHGARIDNRCGAHVHIGMDQLDTARQRWRRFFKITSGYEECIYRAAGGDSGRIRSGHSDYSEEFSARADFGATTPMTLDNDYDLRMLTSRVSRENRYYGINLTNIYDNSKPNTVEFRYFNGSLNPTQLQANIKLANGVMMAAEKARSRDVESDNIQTTESFKRRSKLISDYKNTSERSNKKMMEFVDIIFTRKRDKDALISVFSKNRWR